jgi:hypothetical protein
VNVVLAILILAIVTVVVLAVGAPLRRAERERASGEEVESDRGPDAQGSANRHDDLLAAREAKYREIRDAELDYRTGKLSREDFDAIDAELRAQAIEILNRLESDDRPPGSSGEADERHGQTSAESKTECHAAARPRDA